MLKKLTENRLPILHFENHIVQYLTTKENGGVKEYHQVPASKYDRENCILPSEMLSFIVLSQEDKYRALKEQLGNGADGKIIERVVKSLKVNKTLSTLRNGIKMNGLKLDLAYFQPANNKTSEHEQWYKDNRLSIVRQLAYSNKKQQ